MFFHKNQYSKHGFLTIDSHITHLSEPLVLNQKVRLGSDKVARDHKKHEQKSRSIPLTSKARKSSDLSYLPDGRN